MKKIPPFLAAFAIITSPIAAQATVVTYGDLQYDALSGPDIVNTVTGKRYLNLSEGKDWTYAVTLDKIANGGYGDYHIASQQEAFEFANAFKIGAFSDTEGHTPKVYSFADWIDGSFGPNHSARFDGAWFLSDEFQGAGQISLRDAPRLPNLLRINDIAGTIAETDTFATGGADSATPVPWLLVKDVTPVPLPATVWLMGSALVGLAGFARRKVGA